VNTSGAQRRRDLHNTSINVAAAIAGQCGFTHVASGRVCHLPHGHPGPCDLRYLAAPTADANRQRGTSRYATPDPCEEHS
jgi:hypothetical protein